MSLHRLTGADGRESVVKLAASAESEEEARTLTSSTQMLAYYHKTVASIKEVKVIGVIVGKTRDGNIILPLQGDYIAWTPGIAEFTQHPDLQTPKRNLWSSGKFSPLARKELKKLGWTIKEEVRFSGK